MGEAASGVIKDVLHRAEAIVASDLTLAECDRALIRAHATGILSELETARRRNLLEASSLLWTRLTVDGAVLERARRRFPVEPIRTLDALHLASALVARAAVPDLEFLSLDKRVRDNAAALGFVVLPRFVEPPSPLAQPVLGGPALDWDNSFDYKAERSRK
jgi:predicted nucleic acid-binding protein